MDIDVERMIPSPLVNSTFFSMLLWSLTRQKHSPDTVSTFHKDYDYVIVGGGTAGSVLAARLSEKHYASVLLLEAGGPPPIITEVPGIQKSLVRSYLDWKFYSTPQRYTAESMENRQIYWASGKALGGSSIINGLVSTRGHPKIYSDWADQGAKGWSYEDLLPYFMKLEENKNPEYIKNGFHGCRGPMTTVEPPYDSVIREPLLENAKRMGYQVGDINGPLNIGYYDLQATIRDGQRLSTAKGYLVPAEHRRNLDILPNAFVRKVIIEDGRAIGVQFDFERHTYEVNAEREVILSAGTINTAQLLMLSGIGPREELEKFQIPVTADLPVGRNLQNHWGVPMVFLLDPSIETKSAKLSNDENIAEYIHHRTGPLASSAFIITTAVLNSNRTVPRNVPDYELYWQEIDISTDSPAFGLRKEVSDRLYGPYAGQPVYVCLSHILQPKSRGAITLQSPNPYDHPLIEPNYFQDPADVDIIVEALKECMRVGTSESMQAIGSTPITTLFPNCEQYAGDENSYYACMARQFVAMSHHQVGTAKMGDSSDPTTVVDPKLRVKNIQSLRVVDASVMPLIPTAHTYVPTIMVAEKASDIIKSSFECNPFRRRHREFS